MKYVTTDFRQNNFVFLRPNRISCWVLKIASYQFLGGDTFIIRYWAITKKLAVGSENVCM